MSILKKLASQTAIYGLSSIFGRFLNYLLVPLYTYYFTAAEYGVVSEFYAYAGFFSVLLLFGFETGYFRFRDKEHPEHDKTYSTALIFIVLLNVGFLALILTLNPHISAALHYENHPEYVRWFCLILVLDSISAIPFARLRAEEKAWRFAGIKVIEILITIAVSLFFIVWCPKLVEHYPHTYFFVEIPNFPEYSFNLDFSLIYQAEIGVGYIFIANLIASIVKFFLLAPQFKGMVWGFDRVLFKKLWRYCLPMVIIGFAGIINEMLDRALLKYLLPYDNQTNMKMLGIYGACYKLSILMSLFIQAFRYAAEPFFFAYSDKNDAKAIYAKVLKFFVIFCVFIFLLVTLYIDFFKYFIGNEFRAGLHVVPILLLANLCLGIYVNLSIWYKLTDRTGMGAWVSLGGALLTIALNWYWIPLYGYEGSAWATLACYGSMAVASYILGQIYYPVAYELKRILAYISLGLGLYFAYQQGLKVINWQPWLFGSALLLIYLLAAALFERQEFSRKIKS